MDKNKIQADALSSIANYNRCTVAISMGVGKTRIGLKWLENKGKALIVVPKNSIKESWTKEKNIINSPVELEFVTYLSLNKKDPNDYKAVVLDECHNLLNKHREFLGKFNGKILGMTGTPPVRKSSEKYSYAFCWHRNRSISFLLFIIISTTTTKSKSSFKL